MMSARLKGVETGRTYCLYHANCPDGFAAAWVVWSTLKDVTFIPCRYGDAPPEMEDGSRVILVDFTFDRKTILALAEKHELTVLDHHVSAEVDLKGLPCAIFDMSKSGGVLAWEYFRLTEPVPELLKYIQDWDLSLFELPHSKEISAAILSYPYAFELWNSFQIEELKLEGKHIVRNNRQIVEAICKCAVISDFQGFDIPMANATCLWSDVGARLLELFPKSPFVLVWFKDDRGLKVCSLRSRGDFDCAKFAARFGGGGHSRAAGMRLAA